MDLVTLHSTIREEFNRGTELMAPEHYYLMEVELDTLLGESLEHLRGWLCTVKLARGDVDGAVACYQIR